MEESAERLSEVAYACAEEEEEEEVLVLASIW